MTTEKIGSCLCGAVTIKSTAPMETFCACHCVMCRKWAGGPYMEVECADGITIEGGEHITNYNSSEWAERGFCKQCGSHLYYHLKNMDKYHVSIGLFADSIDPKLTEQVFIDKKPSGYSFKEQTTDYTEKQVFEMFGVE